MANMIYTKAKEGFATGNIDWAGANIKAVLVDAALYTPNFSTDEYLSDIPAGARVSTTATLTGRTATGGVMVADSSTFTAVPAGPAAEYVVFYADSGVASTSRLILYLDTATGLPITPNGQNVALVLPGAGLLTIG